MPLNPTLYHQLREEFGSIQIAHEGIAAAVRHIYDPVKGRLTMRVDSPGEYYKVACPFCHDTRGRLWINHLWGVFDPKTGSHNLWLAHCYNEDCLAEEGRARELYERVYGFKNANVRGRRVEVLPGKVESATLNLVRPPGALKPLDELPDDHPANAYLRDRGFDPVQLARDYGLAYCLEAPMHLPAEGRIVIPIVMRGQLVGWQCRYVGEEDWKETRIPKYYSCPHMPKRLMLYNFDAARKHPFVVLCEGPSDVWRVGKQAVALMGKTISPAQVQLVSQVWGQGSGVILLDGDAQEDARKVQEALKGKVRNSVVVGLPPDQDPGSCSTEELWDRIDAACEGQGLDLLTFSGT